MKAMQLNDLFFWQHVQIDGMLTSRNLRAHCVNQGHKVGPEAGCQRMCFVSSGLASLGMIIALRNVMDVQPTVSAYGCPVPSRATI